MTQLVPGNSLGFLLADLARLHRQTVEKLLESVGMTLTSGEIRTLAYIARFPDSSQTLIADRMGVEPMTLSAFLDRLEAQGLVQRVASTRDRRAKVIKTTPALDPVFEQVRPIVSKVFEKATADFSAEEAIQLQTLLLRVRANLSGETERTTEAPAVPA